MSSLQLITPPELEADLEALRPIYHEDIRGRITDKKRTRHNNVRTACPACNGHNCDHDVENDLWQCRNCNEGGGMLAWMNAVGRGDDVPQKAVGAPSSATRTNGHHPPPSAMPEPDEGSEPPHARRWPIRDTDGHLIAWHVRPQPGEIGYHPNAKYKWWRNGSLGLDGVSQKDIPLYLSERIDGYDRDQPIIVTEGETAADPLLELGVQVVAITGTPPRPERLEPIEGWPGGIYYWPDNDTAGADHAARFKEALPETHVLDLGTLWAPVGEPAPKADGREWCAMGGTLGTLQEAIEKARKPIQAVSCEQLMSMTFPPRRWILEGFIQERDAVNVFAYRGTGKSWASAGIALGVASGRGWCKWKTPRPHGVLVVDGEMPREDMQERYYRLGAPIGNLEAPLRFLIADMYENGIPSLASPEGQKVVEDNLDETIGLVIIDSLATLYFGGQYQENEAEAYEALKLWVMRLRRMGYAVMAIMHSGKDESRGARGSSAKEDIATQVLSLSRPKECSVEEGAVFRCELTKNRGVTGDLARPFTASLIDDDSVIENGLRWEWSDELDREAQSQLARIMHGQGRRAEDIAKELGVSRATVYRLLNTKGIK